MQQQEYEDIISCIRFGMPAKANQLATTFTQTTQLATEHIALLQEQEKQEKVKQEQEKANIITKKEK